MQYEYDLDASEARTRAAARAERRIEAAEVARRREATAKRRREVEIARGEAFDPGRYGQGSREFGEFAGELGGFFGALRDSIAILFARRG